MDLSVRHRFETYPEDTAVLLMKIRTLILNVAEQDSISPLIETLKWGEPSYIYEIGSTIKFDWKEKDPEQ